MSQLSWLIYLAGVANYIGGWATAFSILTFSMCVIITVWYVSSGRMVDRGPPKPAWIMYPIFIFFLVVSTMVPSRETVLAIAASEVGQQVLTSPQAKQVGAALLNWIEEQSHLEKPHE